MAVGISGSAMGLSSSGGGLSTIVSGGAKLGLVAESGLLRAGVACV
jgi:hypothetical protein